MTEPPSYKPTIIQRVLHKVRFDQDLAEEQVTAETVPGFPWTYPRLNQRPIGTLFAETVPDSLLKDMYRRYPLARRVIDAPVEESFYQGFNLRTDPRFDEERANALIGRAWWLYNREKFKILRFCKLVRLFGRSELLFGWNDPKTLWNLPVRYEQKRTWGWTQPVPIDNELELKETDTIPIKVEYLSVNFGVESINQIHPSRFIHAMNPKLIEEDKEGESSLLPIANMLQIKIHSDWSLGQAFWRNAAGLLALFAPKRNVSPQEITNALASVENRNAKTTVYVPFGWSLKNILKGNANIGLSRNYRLILENIAAGTGIPVSILLGSQRGALAPPDADVSTYFRTVGTVQANLITPTLNEFFRKGRLGGLIPPGPLYIDWNQLEYKGEVEKAHEQLELAVINKLLAAVEDDAVEPKEMVKLMTRKTTRRK